MENSNKRILWVDLLRIIATWGVISIHGKSCYTFETGTFKWYECNIIGFAFVFCVPVFLMLSGYLSLKKEVSIKETIKRRIPKVLLMKIFSIILCAITGFVLAIIKGDKLVDMLVFTKDWGYGSSYFAILAGCYLVAPFLYLFIKDIKYEKYFLILSVIFCFIIPIFCDLDYVKDIMPNWIISIMDWFDYGEVYLPVGSTLFFVLGNHLGKVSEKISKRNAIIFFLIRQYVMTSTL